MDSLEVTAMMSFEEYIEIAMFQTKRSTQRRERVESYKRICHIWQSVERQRGWEEGGK